MKLRPHICFSSGFPDDAVWGADEICEVPPGRNVAEFLKLALEGLDYRVSDPIDAGAHGWELEIWSGRQRLRLQVSMIDADENHLFAEPFWWLPDVKVVERFLSDLQRILEAEPRFKRIRWFAKGGFSRNEAPAKAPFDT